MAFQAVSIKDVSIIQFLVDYTFIIVVTLTEGKQ